MAKIAAINGREILDSRGNPTIEADVSLEDGSLGRAAVPSGGSTGEYEAVELRDGDRSRYLGKGTRNATVYVCTEIGDALRGMDAIKQQDIDRRMAELDGTANKARIGANAILAVSMAVARTAAYSQRTPLYRYIGGVGASVVLVSPIAAGLPAQSIGESYGVRLTAICRTKRTA
jgi:enolase